MTEIWTIEYNGTEKTVADWGLENLQLSLVNQDVDRLTFTAPSQDIDTEIFPYDATLVLKRNGVTWFTGTVVTLPGDATEQTEQVNYEAVGAHQILKDIRFQQKCYRWDADSSTHVVDYSTHLNLGLKVMAADGEHTYPYTARATVAEAVTEVLEWAKTFCAAPISYDVSGLPAGAYFPSREERDLSCAVALDRILRWVPDVIAWWDYSTAQPTIRFKQRASLTQVTFTMGIAPLQRIGKFTPRHDLVPPAVCLNYEVTTEYNGQQQVSLVKRVAPVGASDRTIGAMVVSIDLKGATTNVMTGTIKAQRIDLSSLELWKRKNPWLNDARFGEITIVSSSPASLTYPNEIVEGSWAEWMQCHKQTVTAYAKLKIPYKDENSLDGTRYDVVSTELMTTDAPCNEDGTAKESTYTTVESYDEGETIPDGLETILYNAWQALQYSGEVTLNEAEAGQWLTDNGVSDSLGVGCCVNIAGSKVSAWGTMKAVVQRVTVNIDQGTTMLVLGPPEHISVDDIIAVYELTRTRHFYTNPSIQARGSLAPAEAELPKEFARHNGGSSGGVSHEEFVVALGLARILLKTNQDGNPVLSVFKNATTGDKYAKMEVTGEDTTLSAAVKVKDGNKVVDINTADAKLVAGSNSQDMTIARQLVPICLANEDYYLPVLAGDYLIKKSDGSIVTLASLVTLPTWS